MDERIIKLPRWAQDIIRYQQGKINVLREELASLGAQRETDMSFESYGLEAPALGSPRRFYLPDGRVIVHLGKDRWNREHNLRLSVESNVEGAKVLTINATAEALSVEPRASNLVNVTSWRAHYKPEPKA